MKRIGIIGGTGPETTVEYYRRIIAAYREKSPQGSFPSILINSIDARRLIGYITAGQLDQVADMLVEEVVRLADAGADFGAIAANTPHVVFDEVRERSSLPLISIVEATADAARERALTKLGLLGTHMTMESAFYPRVFARIGVEIVVPDATERDYIHTKYMGELFNGVILDETREALTAIVSAIARRDGIDGIILGGTELSLIFTEPTCAGIPVLDTTQIHVDRIVSESLA